MMSDKRSILGRQVVIEWIGYELVVLPSGGKGAVLNTESRRTDEMVRSREKAGFSFDRV
jgi:hypothetical protein